MDEKKRDSRRRNKPTGVLRNGENKILDYFLIQNGSNDDVVPDEFRPLSEVIDDPTT